MYPYTLAGTRADDLPFSRRMPLYVCTRTPKYVKEPSTIGSYTYMVMELHKPPGMYLYICIYVLAYEQRSPVHTYYVIFWAIVAKSDDWSNFQDFQLINEVLSNEKCIHMYIIRA
jgi:hypothetical protein